MLTFPLQLLFLGAILSTNYLYRHEAKNDGAAPFLKLCKGTSFVTLTYLLSGGSYRLLTSHLFKLDSPIHLYFIAGLLSLLVSLLSSFLVRLAPLERKYLLLISLLLAVGTFPNLIAFSAGPLGHSFIYAGQYFIYTFAFWAWRDRQKITPLLPFLNGLPLDILTLLLFQLSFSFLNGVFFGKIF